MSADQQVHLRMSRGVTTRLFCADRTGGENQRHNVVAAHLVAAIASFERHLNDDRGDGDFGASSSPSNGSSNNHWALSVS